LRSAGAEGDALRAEVQVLREQLTALDDLPALRRRCEAAEATQLAAEAERRRSREALDEYVEEHDRCSAQIVGLEQRLLAANEVEARFLAELRERAEQGNAAQLELQRAHAARDQLETELAARRAAAHQIDGRLAAAERAAQLASEQHTQVQEQALHLQDQLREAAARLAALGADLEQERRDRAALQSALGELRARSEQERAEATDAGARVAAAAERDELLGQVEALAAGRETLQLECDQLRQRHAAAGEEADRQAEEVRRLRTRVEEFERQQPEPTQGDSQVASLNGLANQRLLEQLRVLRQACETDSERLPTPRRDRDLLERRPGGPEASGAQRAATEPLRGSATQTDSPAGDGQTSAGRGGPARALPKTRAANAAGAEPPAAAILLEPGEELTVVHVEDHAPLLDAVRAAVERCAFARYAALHDIPAGAEGSTHLLAVNLLARDIDPLATICDPRWRLREPRAFTYLAAGGRGIVAGLTDFLPHPLDPNDCVTRLLERPGGTQRLLIVSDKIDAMNEIRNVLNRVNCSTSLALDDRQGFNLAGMVKPDAILIDLTLPRGEGLRLIYRLRANPKTAGIAIIFALGEPFDAVRFQAEARRILGDCRFSDEDLSGALARVLSEVQTVEAQRETA
jgi:CheY-like chemotaxis protein